MYPSAQLARQPGNGTDVEEPPHGDELEQFLEWTVLLVGLIQEALRGRGADVATAYSVSAL